MGSTTSEVAKTFLLDGLIIKRHSTNHPIIMSIYNGHGKNMATTISNLLL
jgi:hypothetical protein